MVTRNSIYFGFILVIFVGISVAIVLSRWQPQPKTDKYSSIQTFEECVKAKFPVVESYPRRCHLPDKRVLMETVATQECKTQADCPGDLICINHICVVPKRNY
jgi:hypothetical protein